MYYCLEVVLQNLLTYYIIKDQDDEITAQIHSVAAEAQDQTSRGDREEMENKVDIDGRDTSSKTKAAKPTEQDKIDIKDDDDKFSRYVDLHSR